jgi:hypothetical protein
MEVQMWPIEKLIFYARNPRKNDKVVDRMVASLREFGFKIRLHYYIRRTITPRPIDCAESKPFRHAAPFNRGRREVLFFRTG